MFSVVFWDGKGTLDSKDPGLGSGHRTTQKAIVSPPLLDQKRQLLSFGGQAMGME